jgi:acyl carrier protein
MSEVTSRVTKLLAEHLGVEEPKLTNEARFVEDLGADSLDVVEVIMALENEFNIDIGDDTAENLATVGAVIDHINSVPHT